MSSRPESSIKIELNLNAAQPDLLDKLDALVRLGLISDDRLRVLCREYLSAALPELEPAPVVVQEEKQWANEPWEEVPPPVTPQPSPRKPQLLQSLMAEISVRWLLFLGVFMVVLSSGVLVATQWERFPPAGQYLVLFAYTVIFWGVSRWAQVQRSLDLTAQTLQLVTLLLIPLNFWAMDGLRLWQSLLGWGAIAIATPVLSAIAIATLQIPATDASRLYRNQWLPISFYLVPCYLQWGWGITGFPLIAAYLATIVTAIATVYRPRSQTGSAPESESTEFQGLPRSRLLLLLYVTAVVLGRAIFLVGVPIAQLGLAIGIAGWIILQSDMRIQPSETRRESAIAGGELPPIALVGGGLLFLGWLVSVQTQPWQAIAVSGLALSVLSDRLRRFFHLEDFVAILAIVLQGYWLIRNVIPPGIRSSAIATSAELARAQDNPWVLLGLTFFPYLLFVVLLSDWLYQRPETDLETGAKTCAEVGDRFSIVFGILLTVLTVPNPSMRSLNLLLSTITLAIVTYRRWDWRMQLTETSDRINVTPDGLIYSTHFTALLAVVSTIHWGFPNLGFAVWATIFLGIAICEWLVSVRLEVTQPRSFGQSAWYLGLGGSGVSYILFLQNSYGIFEDVRAGDWALLWLLVPIALSSVAQVSRDRRQLASILSVVGLILVQLLTIQTPATQLFGFGVGTALMVVNARYLRHPIVTAIAIGFGLCFSTVLLSIGVLGLPPVRREGWMVVAAVASAMLFLSCTGLNHRNTTMARLYSRSADGWAIAIALGELSLLSLHSFNAYSMDFQLASAPYLIGNIIITLGLAYRSWQHPANWIFYGVGWSLEVMAAETLMFFEPDLISLAIANIILGAIGVIVGELWIRRTGNSLPSSWNAIPLLYGTLGAALRWETFNEWTGLTTLGLVLIAIGVGRRSPQGKPLIYLALIGVSLSAYELLFQHIATLPASTQFIAIATLGAGIMYDYQLLSPWLKDYLHLTSKEIKFFAHLHWGLSSLVLASAIAEMNSIGMGDRSLGAMDWVGLGTGIFLSNYAIAQGRQSEGSDRERIEPGTELQPGEIWVYLGILEAAAIGFYLFGYLPTNLQEMLVGWGGAIACVAGYFLDFLPWESWGWSSRPWRTTGIALPAIAAVATSGILYLGIENIWYASTAIVAAFYIFLSKAHRDIRLTYCSMVAIDWVLLRWFNALHLQDFLWYMTPIALSVLYVTQVEPSLKTPESKTVRHILRMFAIGSITFTVFLTHHWFVTGLLSLGVIFAGLILRIRAFLYVGTAVFLLNAINQLIILNALYSFLRWVIGLIVGIALIWIAATFETRREQIVALLQNWLLELESWE